MVYKRLSYRYVCIDFRSTLSLRRELKNSQVYFVPTGQTRKHVRVLFRRKYSTPTTIFRVVQVGTDDELSPPRERGTEDFGVHKGEINNAKEERVQR